MNISNNERESVVIIDDIYWNYIKYDAIRLGYYISNKQNEFLVTVGLIRMFDTAEEAKNFREKVKHSLVYDFGKESVKEKIEENGFKSYTVMHDIGHVKGSVRMQKIQLVIDKGHDGYAVIVNYNGWDEILDYMQSENNW